MPQSTLATPTESAGGNKKYGDWRDIVNKGVAKLRSFTEPLTGKREGKGFEGLEPLDLIPGGGVVVGTTKKIVGKEAAELAAREIAETVATKGGKLTDLHIFNIVNKYKNPEWIQKTIQYHIDEALGKSTGRVAEHTGKIYTKPISQGLKKAIREGFDDFFKGNLSPKTYYFAAS